MAHTMFGIFHTAYERAGEHFFEIAACDYVNTVLVESDYKSEQFAVSLNELKKHPDKKAWVACSALGFIIKNQQSVADTGEQKAAFNPQTQMLADYKERIDEFIAYLKKQGWYDTIAGFYMDEPLLWNITNDYLEEFTKKHWDKIKAGLELNDTQVETLKEEIRKLNPKPGASMGETEGRNMQQITPDFIIDTNDDGSITFTLNRGNVPELTVSPSFTDMIDTYKKHKEKMSRQDKEALLYAKEKVDKAQGFIEAIKQRRHTLIVTMKAIIDIQRQFFMDGDEADLKPMILKDIADRTGLDISTISRVSNVKYAQTKWGIFPLKFFFGDSYVTENGEEMATRKIKLALQELINKEDKKKPLSDEALAKALKEKGFPIARRTVAKYREQFGIPVARLRK